ncbi:hypothetical protein CFP56_037502 [Quercus suber]|uniref:Uncharacterized protein n=1 Tax=Quercus suber TaxID=58331 RepID=A0AAW0J4E6_QUESU
MSFCGSCSQDLTPNPSSPTGNLPPNVDLDLPLPRVPTNIVENEDLAWEHFGEAVKDKDINVCYNISLKDFEHSGVHDLFKLLAKQKDELLATANQKMKTAVAKVVHAFQLIDEYNAILFGWFCKGFELLRRYLIKHGPGIDLEDLDFEAIDKEIKADEAA